MDVEKLAAAIRKARDEAESVGLDRITVPFKETDIILHYLELLKKQKEQILNVVWDVLHEGLSIDCPPDQDYVYEIIQNRIDEI